FPDTADPTPRRKASPTQGLAQMRGGAAAGQRHRVDRPAQGRVEERWRTRGHFAAVQVQATDDGDGLLETALQYVACTRRRRKPDVCPADAVRHERSRETGS